MDVVFSPEGRTLVTTASDATVILWDLSPILDDVTIRSLICLQSDQQRTVPSTMLSEIERHDLRYFAGRPPNVCDWRGPWSPSGFPQSIRAMAARTLRAPIGANDR
jgi:WD40 repeat protein